MRLIFQPFRIFVISTEAQRKEKSRLCLPFQHSLNWDAQPRFLAPLEMTKSPCD